MTIAQYLRLLRNHWITVTLLTVLGTLGAGVFSFAAAPAYEARVQLFVSTSGQSNSPGELSQANTFTQQRVKSYTDLLTSPKVLEPVINNLELGTTADQLGQRVTTSSPLDTVLIDVTVQDNSPTRAADIANAIAVQFPKFVNELETRPGQSASPVKVSITRPAFPPAAPVSPRTTLNLMLGLLIGLGLGVGTAVLRDNLDRTINSRAQVNELVDAPVLGTVMDDPQAAAAPLISHDAFSPRAESFRQLRTNIRFLSVDHRVTSMVVTGSVPSEGKTTTAANIAISLAQNGEQVVLVDADLRRPTIADLFGVSSGVGLTTVLLGDVGVDTALQRWRDDLPLFLLASGPLPPNPSELIGSARMAELVHHLTGHGMTVVVDSPPLLPVTDAAILARVTDGALVVTRAASTKVDQLSAAVESLRTAGAPILGVVINRMPRRGRAAEAGHYQRYGSYAPTSATQPGSSKDEPSSSRPEFSLDTILQPTAPSTLLSPLPVDQFARQAPAPVAGPATERLDQVSLRQTAMDDSQVTPEAVNGAYRGAPALTGAPGSLYSSPALDRSPTVNGVSALPDSPSPYRTAPPSRPRGRRSATPPDQPT